jgi:hypothetical protein
MGDLPKYRNVLTPSLNLPDKMEQSYEKVITQIYPLRADLQVLQEFCDRCLNFIEDKTKPPFRFAAAAPFVILQVAHLIQTTTSTRKKPE